MQSDTEAMSTAQSNYVAFGDFRGGGYVLPEYQVENLVSELLDTEQLFDDKNVVQWYKQLRNHLAEVYWPGDDNRTVVLKSYGARRLTDRIRNCLRPAKAAKHWRNALLLQQAGINSPRPICLFSADAAKKPDLLAVMPAPPHKQLRQLMQPLLNGASSAMLADEKQVSMSAKDFVVVCGRYVRAIHDAGFVHRDLSGGNILVPNDWLGDTHDLAKTFILVDINRVRQVNATKMSINLRIQDLERIICLRHCYQNILWLMLVKMRRFRRNYQDF